MRSRHLIWTLLCLLLLAGAWLFRQQHHSAQKKIVVKPAVVTVRSASTAPKFLTAQALSKQFPANNVPTASTNKFAYRLSNTGKTIGELVRDDKAVLLENALIDTRNPLNFSIPKNLQSQGDPGAYIVQANAAIDNAFRAMLAAAGATIVSYIPNDAYLVRISGTAANGIASQGFTVIPYEPYYKVQSPLLAYDQGSLPSGTALNLGLFGDDAPATIQQIQKLGWQIFAQDTSPFGSIVRVTATQTQNWTALAQLPGVQIVEPYHKRVIANDLARVTLGISTDTVTSTNYMNLTGKNVIVEVNDTGIDAGHPDFATSRVIGDVPQSLVDTNGHGTHVAGIIAGNGAESSTINTGPNLPQGSVTNANFRGKAPNATLYSIGFLGASGEVETTPDSYLQQSAALTNALISNNSWGSEGDDTYDLEAASYDAAVRDALPGVTGSQPVLFVFAAGNDGGGDNSGGSGTADSISSPGTAKDVITVGATEQLRNITNIVTALDGTSNAVWQPMTDTSYQVADYSSRGNVGIGIEGTFGRYKPDVVAPGTFVVSTRSEQWDQAAYYNPTNVSEQDYPDQTVGTNSVNYNNIDLSATPNVVGITIEVVPNDLTTGSLNLPIYVSSTPDPNNFPDPTTPATYFVETNTVTIPPNGGAGYLAAAISSGGFNYAVGNSGTQPADYDLIVEITTTNDLGNYDTVLSNLNNTIGPWYRYESGTSMATPAVSGVLALIQDFFTNQLSMRPSPALMKAMVINGARTTGFYNLQVQNSINFEGWGLANLPDSLPPGIATNVTTSGASMFIQDQSPNSALATGDSQTFMVTLNTNASGALTQPLRVTVAWTDPPGNPAAAIKLVNELNLVVTNLDNPSIVYYGNDIASGNFNNQENTNSPPVFDAINNIENVYLPAGAGTNFSVTVEGYRVNVNAVTAQKNNVAQDYALVISSGNGQVTNAITVTTNVTSFVSNPTSDQQITFLSTNNLGELLNQTVGANSPLLGTNTISFGTNAPEGFGPNNWQVTIGQTNQWHFYVVTNNGSSSFVTNAAFTTSDPNTLSIPRMGVFADSQANATQPEADIDLYVSTDPTLTNLNPVAISNCVISGTQVGASVGLNFTNASLSRGGTEFVVDTNSKPGEVYYVGVKSETQEASEYDFLPIFSATPFSAMMNGAEVVTGFPLYAPIPGGNPAVPGFTNVVGVATFPIQAREVVVSNIFYTENFGDLVGAVNHDDTSVILNSHDSINTPGTYTFIYDDSGENDIVGSQPSDGPGSLNSFIGGDGVGEWILHEADNAEGFSNVVDSFNVTIQPHLTDDNGHTNTIASNGSFLDFVDVPPGATNLTITVTNLTGTANPPLELFVSYGAIPTTNNVETVLITNVTGIGTELQGSISIVPPMVGIYYFEVFNPSATAQSVIINATVGLGTVPAEVDFTSSGPVPLLDDAVTSNSIAVTSDKIISSVDVALRVDHPRVSDLVFHLISPDGTRDLLVENRGGTTTNGMGVTLTSSNTVVQPQTSSGDGAASTNIVNTGQTNGTLTIQYNFYAQPDEMVVYDQTNLPLTTNSLIFDSGEVSGSGVFNIPYTNAPLTIIMNPNGNGGAGDLWDYTVDATGPSYEYLVLTENTNLTTTPIKFAPPPFGLTNGSTNSDLFYLPEQSLDTYAGENANGLWTLEVQDDRAGATNFAASLVSWQLRFQFTTPTTPASSIGTLTNGVPQTNTIPADSTAYYLVSVPTNADFATNSLFTSSGPLSLWFNQTTLPTGTNAGDYLLFSTSTNDSTVLSTSSSPTNIVPGGSYYLAVQNTNSFAVTNYGIEVSFHFVAPPLPVITISSITHTNIGGTNGFWLKWFAPTNDIFQVQWTGNLAPPIGWNTFSNIISYNGPVTPTNGLFTFFDNGSQFPFGPLRFYRLILLGSSLTGGVPQTNTIPANSIAYYLINVPTNADFATNSMYMNGQLNLLFNETAPPTGTNAPDYLLFSSSTSDSTVLGTNSTPTNIVPGGFYYLGVQNTNNYAVSYGIAVNFDVPTPTNASTNAISISSITFTAIGGTNGILLTWHAPTNYQFQIQWTTGLSPSPIFWTTIPGAVPTLVAVSGTTGTYQYFDDFYWTGGFGVTKFYRLIAYPPGVPVPPALIVSSVQTFPGGGVQIQWSGSASYLYDILWTTNLALPSSNWNVLSNLTSPVLTYSGGVYTFKDATGTLTGGAAVAKFFQILELP